MKASIGMLIFIFFSLYGYGQGGANIIYIKEDTINEKHTNQEVKIDFTSSRSLSSPNYRVGDTIELFMLQDLVFIRKVRPKRRKIQEISV